MIYKSKHISCICVVKVKFSGEDNGEDCLQQRVKKERLRNMTCLTSDTKSFDGQWYICHGCKRSIERGNVPSCNEKHHNFQVPDMPHEFKTEDMTLNKLESHLLKLIIPFIRVVHIPRSSEFKILGPMICVEADVKQTMDKLLPVEQDLIPVCLKRRPEYKGHFIEEVVSMTKIVQYFEYFKAYNPLFKDVEFSEEKLNRILSENLHRIAQQDERKTSQLDANVDHSEREIQNDTASGDGRDADDCNDDDGEVDLNKQNETSEEKETDDLSHDYSLPHYQTEVHDDTVIEPLTVTESRYHISDIIANAVVEQEQYQRTLKRRSKLIEKVEVAPTAASNFKYWESAKDLEEKAFPHLFPTGTGGYLSTHQKNGVGFANYVKQRILGKDCRYRDDGVYMAFLFMVKEQIEIKRSVCTFFRKSKVNRMTYDVNFLKSADKSEIERTDLGYRVFKNMRGTAPYFQQVKLKVMTMIRQLGAPTLFLTLSAAETHWTDLIKNLLQKERNCVVSDEDVQSLTKADVNKLISRNVTDVTMHFSNRMKIIYKALSKPGIFDDYYVSDHFYRIEFQQRGAPHIHSLLWLKDHEGNSPPTYNGSRESEDECVQFIDKVISGKLEGNDSDENVRFFQSHAHTFTCRKKCNKIVIKSTEGHGKYDGVKTGPELTMNSCRFKFPKFPVRKTCIIDAPDSYISDDIKKCWKNNYLKVRRFILRQTYTEPRSEPNQDFLNLTFDEFLDAVGMNEEEYMNALRVSVAANRSGCEVFLKRDCGDIFVNNFNPKILKVHHANMDLSFILNEYACVAYILGYLTKNESGLSRLLHQIEVESAKYGRSTDEKMKLFSRALDNSREVSRPEVVYRMLGLHFCSSTRTHAFVQTGHPNKRDGLVKAHLEELEENDDPFYNSIIDYYVHRPKDLENVTLAQFVRDYKIVYRSKAEKEADEHVNTAMTDDYTENENDTGTVRCLLNKKGKFRHNNKHTMVRYYLSKQSELEIKRSLLVLFVPFRNELKEIHEVPGFSVDDIYEKHKNTIETIRKQFEPNRQLLLNLEKAIDEYDADEAENNSDPDDDMICEDDQNENSETTSKKDLQHFINLADKKSNTEIDVAKRETICESIKQLNTEQRQIFDDVIERLASGNELTDDANPFYLYISGAAGTGKTFLMNVIREAAKFILMKSGDDPSKPSILVLSPTATAARLVGGQTIESGMKMSRPDDCESYEVFSSNATCAYEYQQVRAIFIDEISMVGSNKLHAIHTRCEQILGKMEKPFAAMSVVCTGDFLQLPPVKDKWIFANNSRPQRADATAPNKWKQNFRMYELTQKMRSLEDSSFSALCDRIGTNSLTEDDVSTLRGRIIACPNESDNDAFKSGKMAIIVKDNEKCSELNLKKLEALQGDEKLFRADDICTNVDHYDKSAVFDLPYTRTASLPFQLAVKLNAPVMLTVNVNKCDGLTNGVRGYVVDIDEKRNLIWVKFQSGIGMQSAEIGKHQYKYSGISGAVPIKKIKASFRLNPPNNSVRIQRCQYPLVLAYAITAHKCQGLTLSDVIIDFSDEKKRKTPTSAGIFYVAATRVKNLSSLYLNSFHRSMIVYSKVVASELERLRNHARYTFYKEPLASNMLNRGHNEEVRIVYLNINGLLLANHLDSLNHDKNLKAADIICIAESKLDETVASELVDLADFRQLMRLDFRHQSMGMIIYTRISSSHVTCEVQYTMNSDHKTQIIQMNINEEKKIAFMYLHPSTSDAGISNVMSCVRANEIIMGDLNIDSLQKSSRNRLELLCQRMNLIISHHGATHMNSQIDHVLVPITYAKESYYVQTYRNFYSDHCAVCLRL